MSASSEHDALLSRLLVVLDSVDLSVKSLQTLAVLVCEADLENLHVRATLKQRASRLQEVLGQVRARLDVDRLAVRDLLEDRPTSPFLAPGPESFQ